MNTQIPTIQEPAEWLTPADAARRIGVSSSFIYKLIRTGELTASRVGAKLLRINTTDLDAIYRPTGGQK
jgi:excisionase family DNA binding protein